MPIISVIVPIYNAEKYIHACVDSILNQSFRSFELLLIDDGSPDNCPAICDEYAKKDCRVRVIHKPNGGVSSARNAGLDTVIGEYVVFIDSDDYVNESYLQGLLEAAADDKNSLIITDYQPFSAEGAEERRLPEPFCLDCDNGTAESFRSLMFDFRLFPPYCKLYRRSIIEERGLRFNTLLRSAEDFDFNMRYIENISRICYLPRADYNYRVGYKKYKPSNRGVLGDSEIESAHIMAKGMANLAKRLGVYDEVYDELCLWAANKHYSNRLRMLFAENKEVSTGERRRLYKRLTADGVYRDLYKRGAAMLPESTTKKIACGLDGFDSWLIFWKAVNNKK